MAKYKVDEKVRIRGDLKAGRFYAMESESALVVPRVEATQVMEHYAGKVITIANVGSDYYSVYENKYVWVDEMLEPLPRMETYPETDPKTEKAVDDPVEHPAHYTSGEIECIDALKASMSHEQFTGFLKGNAMKYLWRYDKKGKAKEDLEKSRWYLDRLWSETKTNI